MDFLHGILVLTLVHTLAAAAPGPDFVFVTQRTLSGGRRAGLLTSLGIALGLSVHITYSAFGLAAVIAHSAELLWWVKIGGGCYLIYLGINGLKSKPKTGSIACGAPGSGGSMVKTVGAGFLCNALNPKAPIYFVSLFTLVLSPDMPVFHVVVYGVWLMIIQLLWFSFVVVVLSIPAVNEKVLRTGHWIDRLLGGAMIGLGMKLLFSRAASS
ncbi:LysE family translocator [Desulforhopalus singaporensis]|uniref:Resistance to homoserine/threonine (RhtB) family protein n=1 Tax=Desulforhopalus singaporensis TaxID=91360 RepID=A0A1H0J0K8_9BACT|nr:LysE family translocator [Desulforhopalus singaporensis]SDO37093.1 resistance to homoserine/threonine (RhtB) family protein [Desulforhopalus singaporensis]